MGPDILHLCMSAHLLLPVLVSLPGKWFLHSHLNLYLLLPDDELATAVLQDAVDYVLVVAEFLFQNADFLLAAADNLPRTRSLEKPVSP